MRLRLFALLTLAAAWIVPCHAQTRTSYYFSKASPVGIDSNPCTLASPCLTMAKAMSIGNALSNSCTSLLFNSAVGNVWHEQGTFGAQVNATSSTTLSNTPPVASGTPTCQFTVGNYGTGPGPIIDGADPLTGTWTLYAGTTYRMPYSTTDTSQLPCKLFMDHPTTESVQVLMATNAVNETFNSAHTYYLGDITSDNHVRGCWPPGNDAQSNPQVWSGTIGPFGNTVSGLTLVQAGVPANPDTVYPLRWPTYPGIYWYDGPNQYLYLTLADGSNPNSHTFEVTTRQHQHCMIRQSVNYNTIQGFTCEHTLFGILNVAYSDATNGYTTNEYNVETGNSVYNWGTFVSDVYTPQTGRNINAVTAMLTAPGSESPVHLVRGNYTTNNRIGTLDDYFGGGSEKIFGIEYSGVDGGGAANLPLITNNYVNTHVGGCIDYETLTIQYTGQVNNGGSVAFNECTGNQTGSYFTATAGGHHHHNDIHDGYGTGIQRGGCSQNTPTNPQIFEDDVIANLGPSPGGDLYNGIDGNSACPVTNTIIRNETIINVYAACWSMEGNSGIGISGDTIYNVLCDQRHNVFGAATPTANNSNAIYWSTGVVHSATMYNNLYLLNNPNLTNSSASGGQSCSSYFTNINGTGNQPWVDLGSKCITSPATAGYNNYTTGDYTLAPGSPAIGAGAGGLNIGATALAGSLASYATRFSGSIR